MAEPAATRTTISIDVDDEIDARLERIGLACQYIMASAREAINKMRRDTLAMTSEVQYLPPHPPAPQGSQQVPPPPPTRRPTPSQLYWIETQAESLVATSGAVAAEFRFWAETWTKAKQLDLREAWCQIMRLIRSVDEIAERFVACVAPFWEHLADKKRYVDGFMDTLEATLMPYLEEVVNIWGQWAHIMTRNHVDGCVGPDCCSMFAPLYMLRGRRHMVLPQARVAERWER